METRNAKRHVQWYYAALLATVAVIAYDPGRPENSSGDTISARYWPVAILKHHTWSLTPFREELNGVGYAALFTQDGTELYPRNGWGMALFTVPFYAVADVVGLGVPEGAPADWTPERINRVSRWNAIALAALSVITLFFFLVRFASDRVALVSAALFAFGTWNWSMYAQGLYSQTAAVLCHMINLHLLWRLSRFTQTDSPRKFAVAAAFLHVVIWSLRPQDIVLVAPAVLLMREKRLIATYLVSFAVFLGSLMIAYSESAYDHVLGAYGVVEGFQGQTTFQFTPWFGFFGLLFSPNRGAIAFFPLLLFVPLVWKKLLPSLDLRNLISKKSTTGASATGIPKNFLQVTTLGALSYFGMLTLVVYWHGTWGYGPRYLYDLLPYIWVPVTLILADIGRALRSQKPRLPRWALGMAALAAVASVAVHALGHFNYDLYVWNHAMVPVNDEKAWRFDELQIEHVWRAGSNANRYPIGALARLRDYGF